jgi:sulfide dehydrogenase cytochrome subunit
MKKILFIFPKLLKVLMGGLLLSAPMLANAIDPSPETTRLLASQCAQCHGTTGNTLGDFDSIAGEDFQELLDELLEMKADNDNEVMHKQIKGYTEQQIWFIAEYYANMPADSNNEGENEDEKDEDEDKKDEMDEVDEEDQKDEEDDEDEEDEKDD